MLRTTNEESSELSEDTMLAPGRKFDIRSRPSLAVGAPVNAAGPGNNLRGGLPARVVRRVREHIEGNIDRQMQVAALAELANLSVCYFARAFKQSVGFTPHDYLIRRRLERTKQLLLGSNMPISEIALAVGFSDQSHCSRRFRQYVGTSPREYRRAAR